MEQLSLPDFWFFFLLTYVFLQLNQLFCLSAAKMTDSSLLNSELELQQQEELYQQLLSQVTAL